MRFHSMFFIDFNEYIFSVTGSIAVCYYRNALPIYIKNVDRGLENQRVFQLHFSAIKISAHRQGIEFFILIPTHFINTLLLLCITLIIFSKNNLINNFSSIAEQELMQALLAYKNC